MKKFFLFTNLFFLSLALGFSAQAKDVGGIIDEDEIWTTVDSPIVVIEDVTVIEGVTLTVEPSVEVKFEPVKTLIIDGTLVARGTSDDKIIFTSNTDTEPGSWGYISFTDTSTDATFDPDGNYTGGCILQYAIVQYGGSGSAAITINVSSPFLDNSTIEENTGAGISVAAGSMPLISNCKIKSNSGGGIAPGVGSISTIKNCLISENSASGISANTCTILIQDSTISGNSSGGGGGISAQSCTITIQNSTISGNSASGSGSRYGGGISASSCTILIQDSTISGNSAHGSSSGGGGGIYASSCTVTIQNNTISGNSVSASTSSGNGGGVYASSSSTVTILESTLNSNTAQTDGGGIYASSSATVTIQDSTLGSNIAQTNGGSIYAQSSTVLTVRNSVLTTNSANSGGGIWGDYKTTIEGNTFKDNSALQQGGAIYASGTVKIKNNILTKKNFGNTAPFGGAIYASGTVTLQKNTVTQNMAPNPFGCVVRLVDVNSNSVIGGSEENANVIKDNFGDGVYLKGDSAFNYNCVHNNGWYEFVCGNSSDGSDIDATNNYWGTTDESEIEEEIWDCEDDDALACVTYNPFLTEPIGGEDSIAPAVVTSLSIFNLTSNSVTLKWTAPGDDGNVGTAAQYDIRYSTSEITDANWDAATQCTDEPAPQPAGSEETFKVMGLSPFTIYYFALKTADEVPNWSELSNVATGKTRHKTGDVSGNGTVSAYDAGLILRYVVGLTDEFPVDLMVSPSTTAPRNYVLSLPSLTVKAGDRIQAPIAINDATGLVAGGITLKFDRNFLKPIKATPDMALNGAFWKANLDLTGEIRFAFASASEGNACDTEEQSNLMMVEFEVLPNTEGKTSPLILENITLSDSLTITKIDGSVTVLTPDFALLQNFPNPFNPETWIPYQLAQDGDVVIRIYNQNGRMIRSLYLGKQNAGIYVTKERAAYWDGRDDTGERVASGIYYYTLRAGDFSATRKMVIVK